MFLPRILALSLAACLIAQPVWALPSEPPGLSLEKALSIAMRRNPAIQVAEARLSQARLELERERQWWARLINGNATYVFGNRTPGYTPATAMGSAPYAAVGVGMNLGDVLNGPRNEKRAEQEVLIAEAELRRTSLEVAAAVTAAYQEYQSVKQVSSFSAETLEAALTDVRLAERQVARGTNPINTLLGARLAVQRARADQVQQVGNVQKAWMNLVSLLGETDWLPADGKEMKE